MAGKISLGHRAGVVLVAILISTLICLMHFNTEAGDSNIRPDIIMIDLPPVPGGEVMPAVQFLHDRHTDVLKGQKDCTACHTRKDNTFIFKYKRDQESRPEIEMAIYHDNCIGCHQETADSGKSAGPVAGECRACHNKKPTATSSWQPLAFDKSLHYRHESSSTIKTEQPVDGDNCNACHHIYDKKAQKTVYAKGEEANCRYCHKAEKTKEARPMKEASHSACINCHQQAIEASKKAGPINCNGCHDLAEQNKITIVEQVPRLKRNQPDSVLLAAWMDRPDSSTTQTKNDLNPVAFNHQAHESKTSDCMTCHHESLKRCSECHTQTGDKKGDFIRLETAMHGTQTEKSCVGCHKQSQTAQNCAGCHAAMPKETFSDMTCNRCHAVDRSAIGLLPLSTEHKAALARETLSGQAGMPVLPPKEEIPETVTINGMTDKYEAVTLPHGKMIRTLANGIQDDRMARFFHNEPTTLCMGCHHNSPNSTKPPKCATCHGEAFKPGQSERPGLKGAYHGQCLSCHQIMKVEEPKATDCVGCHKKRS